MLSPRLCFFIVVKRDNFYLFAVTIHCIDDLEAYQANRATNLMFCTTSETEGEVVHVKLV